MSGLSARFRIALIVLQAMINMTNAAAGAGSPAIRRWFDACRRLATRAWPRQIVLVPKSASWEMRLSERARPAQSALFAERARGKYEDAAKELFRQVPVFGGAPTADIARLKPSRNQNPRIFEHLVRRCRRPAEWRRNAASNPFEPTLDLPSRKESWQKPIRSVASAFTTSSIVTRSFAVCSTAESLARAWDENRAGSGPPGIPSMR